MPTIGPSVHPASLGCRMRTTDTDTRVLITCAREPLHSYSGTLVSGCVCPPSLQCSAKKTNICCSKQDKGLADLWFWWSSKQGKDLTLVILSDHQNTCFCKKLVESVQSKVRNQHAKMQFLNTIFQSKIRNGYPTASSSLFKAITYSSLP